MPSAEHIRIAVIMAGGSGERFWPVSRQLRPKQLLHLTSDDLTLLEESTARIEPLIPPERVFIATARHLKPSIHGHCAGVPDDNVLAEPSKRNTAGCLCFAAANALARYGAEPSAISMAILTADHKIAPNDRFLSTVDAALGAAEREKALTVIGIPPTRPETGYGYIEIADGAEPFPSPPSAEPVFPVQAFREKPDLDTAKSFIETRRFFWNSGMFFWTVESFLRELEHASPRHAAATLKMAAALKEKDGERVESVFDALPNISIDFALMEKARRVAMARADFDWDDVGSWDSLGRLRESEDGSNVAVGDPVMVDAKGCVVYNEPGAGKMAVAVVGAENLIVVTTEDAVLVMPKDRAQDVREAVNQLKERGAAQL